MNKKLIHRIDIPGIIFRAGIITLPFWLLVLGALGYWAHKSKLTWSDIKDCFGKIIDIVLSSLLFVLPILILIGLCIGIGYTLIHSDQIIMWIRWNSEANYHFSINAKKDAEIKQTLIKKLTHKINNKLKNVSESKVSEVDQKKYESFIALSPEGIDTQIKYAVDNMLLKYS